MQYGLFLSAGPPLTFEAPGTRVLSQELSGRSPGPWAWSSLLAFDPCQSRDSQLWESTGLSVVPPRPLAQVQGQCFLCVFFSASPLGSRHRFRVYLSQSPSAYRNLLWGSSHLFPLTSTTSCVPHPSALCISLPSDVQTTWVVNLLLLLNYKELPFPFWVPIPKPCRKHRTRKHALIAITERREKGIEKGKQRRATRAKKERAFPLHQNPLSSLPIPLLMQKGWVPRGLCHVQVLGFSPSYQTSPNLFPHLEKVRCGESGLWWCLWKHWLHKKCSKEASFRP